MANYSLVVNSKYTAPTFEELIAPYKDYVKDYKEQQENIANLKALASEWQRSLDVNSPVTYNIYNDYISDLEDTAKTLMTEGYSPFMRQRALDLKAKYNADILPISKAFEARNKEIEKQRTGGNNYAFEFDALSKNLDDFYKNPTLGAAAIDLNNLYKTAAAEYAAVGQSFLDYANGEDIDEFTGALLQKNGISKTEALALYNNIVKGAPIDSNIDEKRMQLLKSIFDRQLENTGVTKWNNDHATKQVTNTLLSAVSSAIGPVKLTPFVREGKRIDKETEAAKDRIGFEYGQKANLAKIEHKYNMEEIDKTYSGKVKVEEEKNKGKQSQKVTNKLPNNPIKATIDKNGKVSVTNISKDEFLGKKAGSAKITGVAVDTNNLSPNEKKIIKDSLGIGADVGDKTLNELLPYIRVIKTEDDEYYIDTNKTITSTGSSDPDGTSAESNGGSPTDDDVPV